MENQPVHIAQWILIQHASFTRFLNTSIGDKVIRMVQPLLVLIRSISLKQVALVIS
jgi:hypothetical protein